jgi:isopentenyl-diphosphate delta-isomerase
MTLEPRSAAEGEEQVVLVDDAGVAVGVAPKGSVHGSETPLHLAFSCYVFDSSGALLVTRRSLEKQTWPGAWTNTLCGHPLPNEPIDAAASRRARDELGITLIGLQLALPMFRYRATMADGTTEHEVCPVFTAVTADPPEPAPAEVRAAHWQPWSGFRDDVLTGRTEVTPWCVEQVRQLAAIAAHPREIRADWAGLPSAARPPPARTLPVTQFG